jgi:hypothetical protein
MINVWVVLGSASFGSLLGFLTSASNTPIAGVVVTSVFGGVLGILGAWVPSMFSGARSPESTNSKIDTGKLSTVLGLGALAFSLAFVPGSIGGAYYRVVWWPDLLRDKGVMMVPWGEELPSAPPETLMKWVEFSQYARSVGISDNHIKGMFQSSIREPALESDENPAVTISSKTTLNPPPGTPTPRPASEGSGGGAYINKNNPVLAPAHEF